MHILNLFNFNYHPIQQTQLKMPITQNPFYPKLSDLITIDQIPESLGFVQTILQLVFNKIYYKGYQSSISPLGNSAL